MELLGDGMAYLKSTATLLTYILLFKVDLRFQKCYSVIIRVAFKFWLAGLGWMKPKRGDTSHVTHIFQES